MILPNPIFAEAGLLDNVSYIEPFPLTSYDD
jgi:hypothetical protein